jgi:DNA-binding NarL/FixJ family response regulator
MGNVIKVLIVDDHESMCDSLTLALEGTGNFTVVASLKNADYTETFCERLNPDLVIMDVCTEGGASGLDAAKTLRERYPAIKVIVMSGFDEITYAPRAKDAGAHAFVYKSKSLGYFTEAARSVMRGETVFPEDMHIPMPVGEANLTAREMEVLRLMCRHMTSEEIAQELFISESTVKYHKTNILAKTGYAKSMDLVVYVLTKGWINPMY